MRHLETWYLIADGARARIVTRPDAASAYRTVFADESAAARARAHELVSDGPGHVQESANSARHAVGPRLDPHRKEEIKFIRGLAAHLNREAAQGSFDRLVIYAAPRCLAALRAGLAPATLKKLHGEHAKDLTKVPLAELPAHLETAGGGHAL